MERLTLLLCTLLPLSVFANPRLECSLDMMQVDSSASWGVVGDSNQVVDFELTPKEPPYQTVLSGEQTARFEHDQSAGGGRPSRHGLKVSAEFSRGNGLTVNMMPLSFKDEDPLATPTALAAITTLVLEPTEEAMLGLNLSFAGKKTLMLPKSSSLQDLIREGVLKDGDLLSMGIEFCRLHN